MFKKNYKFAYLNGRYGGDFYVKDKPYSFKVRIIETNNDICEIRYDTKNLVRGGNYASEINGLSNIVNINKLEGIHEVEVNLFQRIYWFLTEKYVRL
jgi:hypothetical protein